MRFTVDETFDHRPRRAFDQDLDGAVGQLEHLHDLTDHADAVEVPFGRVLAVCPALGAEEHLLTLRHGRLERMDRPFAPDVERHDHVGKENDVLEGEER